LALSLKFYFKAVAAPAQNDHDPEGTTMNTTQALEQAEQAWRRLQQQWQATKGQWRDPVQRRFEQHYWARYEQTIPRTQRELMRVLEARNRARRNCP